MANLTPMMQQYFDIKAQYPDAILFFRLGDFYEMFFEDAEKASRELEITLTGRDCGQLERAPMCGVPFHSADNYINKLISKGFKVAICEQVEDPALAKGLVKRDVVRVVTPGTLIDSTLLDEKKNNYLMSVFKKSFYYGLAACDVSTGDFYATHIHFGNTLGKFIDEISKYQPSEMIVNSEFFEDKTVMSEMGKRYFPYISVLPDEDFDFDASYECMKTQFCDERLDRNEYDLSIRAVGGLLKYLLRTQKVNLSHIQKYNPYALDEFMALDSATRRNLELTETMREKARKGSILWVLDHTQTSMGARLLRKWVEQPLIDVGDITMRLDAVSEIKEKFMFRMELREHLKGIYDIERLMGKVVVGSANCRDIVSLKNSILRIPQIKEQLVLLRSAQNVRISEQMDLLSDICELIERAILDEPPLSVKEGGLIKDGFHSEVDSLHIATREGKNWIAEIEAQERGKTGIKNLKISFNRVFGYYIEVTKSYFHLVPDHYIRKQTLANCERFVTEELKIIEEKILGAEEKLIKIEYELFVEVRESIAREVSRIRMTANSIAMIDAISSLSEVAERDGYVRPVVSNEENIEVIEGRHPVVEKMIEEGSFVPNDTLLDTDENRLAIITGPNMAGKSTYMRQVALIVLMAQIGSFVPAKTAKIGVVDRIFTRVGASDDLAAGQSTFMVEMSEVANILSNATPKSLLILDEIGRGTSTFDGLSIAWSVVEYISNKEKIGARTLFATHYHELTELEGKLSGIKNYCISVDDTGEDIKFLRKIIRGGADESYGIEVAKLAGVPHLVIQRAKEILGELEDADITKKGIKWKKNKKPIEGQMDLLTFHALTMGRDEVLEELRKIDVQGLTPMDAINTIYRLQQKIKKG